MEAIVEFKRPPRETFHEIVPRQFPRTCGCQVGPDISIDLGVRVKVPGERMGGSGR